LCLCLDRVDHGSKDQLHSRCVVCDAVCSDTPLHQVHVCWLRWTHMSSGVWARVCVCGACMQSLQEAETRAKTVSQCTFFLALYLTPAGQDTGDNHNKVEQLNAGPACSGVVACSTSVEDGQRCALQVIPPPRLMHQLSEFQSLKPSFNHRAEVCAAAPAVSDEPAMHNEHYQ